MTGLSFHPTQDTASRRLQALDAARGVAILAMIVYHAVWDLGFLGLLAQPIALDPPWQAFARIIAASFLTLVGVSLILAHGERLRPRAFVRRLFLVAGAAMLVSAATYLAFPDSYVFFGILHAIALGSVLAVPFLRVPASVVALCAVLVFCAPLVISGVDHPALSFLGLRSTPPRTNDYVPVFPWFGFILAGMVLGRIGTRLPRVAALKAWEPAGRFGRALVWGGRKSLPIYLVHQPVLLALFYPLALVAAPQSNTEGARFMDAFVESCGRAGGDAASCEAAAACTADKLKAEGLWADALSDRLGEAGRERALALARACMADRSGGVSPRPE